MIHFDRILEVLHYYRRFVPSCAETVPHLNSILSPNKSGKILIEWSAEAKNVFVEIKAKLSNATLHVNYAITTLLDSLSNKKFFVNFW